MSDVPERENATEEVVTAPDVVAAPAPKLIGWAEWVDLPRWKIRGIRAKVDTGARTSALHCDNIEPLPGDRIRFDVILHRKHSDRRVTIVARIKRRCAVRSSTGVAEMRYVVSTTLRLAGVRKRIEITLAKRGEMRYRMLLGRAALAGDFVIETGRKYVATSRPRQRRKKSDSEAES